MNLNLYIAAGEKLGCDVAQLALEDGCLVDENEILNALPPGTILKVVPTTQKRPTEQHGSADGISGEKHLDQIKKSLEEIKR